VYSASLRGWMIKGLNPGGGARLSAPDQTGPGAHQASYTRGTRSFPEVKRPGCDVDHPPPPSAEVKEREGLYLYTHFGSSWPVLGLTLPLPLPTEQEEGWASVTISTFCGRCINSCSCRESDPDSSDIQSVD
jgi:hypothetical protein